MIGCRFGSLLSFWFSLDRELLKILCSAVDFALRFNVSVRDIVDGHLVASGFCSVGQIRPTATRPRTRRDCRCEGANVVDQACGSRPFSACREGFHG